jgi:hypothetical protein
VADYRAPHSRIAPVTGFVSDVFSFFKKEILTNVATDFGLYGPETGSAGEGHHPALDGLMGGSYGPNFSRRWLPALA